MIHLENSWDSFFKEETRKDYYQELRKFLIHEYKTKQIYPPMDKIFSIFKEVPMEKIEVVILGQDPYHQPGQAHGMSFSVLPGVGRFSSLVNIFKEITSDIGCEEPEHGCLLGWARQGVFLMNTCLTVEEGRANSHKNKGWEILTDEVIRRISADERPKVFLLWGRDARAKKQLIHSERHLILETVHPSPLSAYNGFFGCRHFSRANQFLRENGRPEIDWCRL